MTFGECTKLNVRRNAPVVTYVKTEIIDRSLFGELAHEVLAILHVVTTVDEFIHAQPQAHRDGPLHVVANGIHDVAEKCTTSFVAATIFIGALVCFWRQEKLNDVVVVRMKFNGIATGIGGNSCRLAIFLNEPFNFINIHCVWNAKVGITTGLLRRRDGLSALQHHLHRSITTSIMNGVLHCLHALREQRVTKKARPVCANTRWFKPRNEWVGHKHGATTYPFVSTGNTCGVVLHKLLKIFNGPKKST